MSAPATLIVAQPHLAGLIDGLARTHRVAGLWTPEGAALLPEARVLVAAGEYRIEPALIERMPTLGLIAFFTAGYDGIDLDWAHARGLAVSHARDANHEDVADHAIGLILAHRRRIVAGDAAVRGGGWSAAAKPLTRSLNGARLGLLGLGAIGRAVARRAEAMRMRVAWWGPRAQDTRWPRAESAEALARDSDVLVVAARATAANRHLVSARLIEALGPDGLLVNVARGQLVDEAALIAALRAGRLGGAALDVFETEPTPPARWRDVPHCVLTPHGAGATDAAIEEMTRQLHANIAAFLAGAPLPSPAG